MKLLINVCRTCCAIRETALFPLNRNIVASTTLLTPNRNLLRYTARATRTERIEELRRVNR